MKQSLPRVLMQNLGVPTARFGLVVLALAVGGGAVGVAWAYVGAYAAVGVGALYYLLWHTPLSADVPAVRMDGELLRFSAPLMVTATMALVLANVDTLLLGALVPTGAVGVYNVAYPMASLLTAVLTSFGFLFVPVISEFHADGDRAGMARTYQVVSKWVFVATLPAFLTLLTFPAAVLGAVFGAAYVPGAAALAVLAVGFFSHAVSGPAGDTLAAAGETRLVMYDNVLVAAVNVALNLVLIPRYSYLGAAAATTAGYLLMNGLYLAQLYRRFGVHPLRRAAAVPGVAGVGLWLALAWVVRTRAPAAPTVAGLGAAAGALYLATALAGGLEREELHLLDRFEDRTGVPAGPARTALERFVD